MSFDYPWDWNDVPVITPKEAEKIFHDPRVCYHEWVKYTGLNEVFEYCKKCDEKKGK